MSSQEGIVFFVVEVELTHGENETSEKTVAYLMRWVDQ